MIFWFGGSLVGVVHWFRWLAGSGGLLVAVVGVGFPGGESYHIDYMLVIVSPLS